MKSCRSGKGLEILRFCISNKSQVLLLLLLI